ncbi:MAG TPA: prepilin-type N-terminal cleavage/methylation domain-containing protein [Verrucomicrobiota bacterium]|nr:prepilin-type N-terminal cleavage/methylation domain-containing protein [Verrucomicrobiota bacterium]
MKIKLNSGFTLIELLTVIAIIAILAGLLLTGVANAKKKAIITAAQIEIKNLVGAITKYEAEYNRYPCPTNAVDDATFGLTDKKNAAIIDILRDRDTENNPNHSRNPRRIVFIEPKLTSSTDAPGVGPDGTWRDPWVNAYIISIDYNYDNETKDAQYGTLPVSVAVWSMGPNGKPGDEDDVKSWTQSKH